MVHRLMALALVVFTSMSLLTIPAVRAEDVKLPPTMTFTAYDTGTAGFNIAVAVGKMMKDKYGTDLRVLPAGNDVARLAPLRAGRAMSSAMGSGTYFAQEGVFEFGAREFWFRAGEPTTKPTRLPLRCLTSVTPVSRATPSEAPLQSTDESTSCSGCGPHSLAPNSNTPSCAK